MAYLPAPAENEPASDRTSSHDLIRGRYLLSMVISVLAVVFLAAPWPFEVKAHAILHGICGQTPSHTVSLGGMELPLDNRCVGIFAGLFVTFLILIALGRSRAAALPTPGAGVLLLGFLGAMAFDGLNSLMTDLGRWDLYSPSNDFRLVTGWMAGVGLGTVLAMVAGMTLWQQPRTSMRILPGWWWPLVLLLPCLPAWLLLESGSRFVYYPASLLLIAAAITAIATLTLCSIVMLRNRDNAYIRFAQLAPLAVSSGLIATAILLAMSGGRFWLERTLNLVTPS